MKTFIGIDLGSTTTKAVVMDENQSVLGRGITNSRSNYSTAARVAGQEARIDGRFTLFHRALGDGSGGHRAPSISLRETISRMISLVPSRIWCTRRSRTIFSMPYSLR